MSVYESVMAAVLGRLQAAPKTWADDVRRAHLTAPPRTAGRVVHLIDGPDNRGPKSTCGDRTAEFTVAVFARSVQTSSDDAGAADALKVEVARRLSPKTAGYASGIAVTLERIAPNTDIADADVTRVDMDFRFTYQTGDEWAL